jgi:ABC-2 type transport system ATP-binding protein
MILQFEDVRKSYGTVRALDGVSFGVDPGEIVAVLGPNGAGKTSALEIALGLRKADSGSVRLTCEVAATPQESGFPETLTVREILDFARGHYAKACDAAETLERFGLSELANRRAGMLSGGESRRLALALAFCGQTPLVILDEPTTGLDVESRRRLWDVVRAGARRRSILFTTHYLEEAEALATRIVLFDRGTVRFDGTPATLRSQLGGRRVSYVGSDGPVAIVAPDADAYVRALVRDGVAFADLEIARPTLEEAFLSMTGGNR